MTPEQKDKLAQIKAEGDLKQALIDNYGTKVFDKFSLDRLIYLIDGLVSNALQDQMEIK